MREPEWDKGWICRRMAQGMREAEQALRQAEKDCSDYIDREVYRQLAALQETCGSEEEYRRLRHIFLQRAAEKKGSCFK